VKGAVLMQLSRDQRVTTDDSQEQPLANGTASDSNAGASKSSVCRTRHDNRTLDSITQSFTGLTTSPAGTPCVFGVDDRDEGSHCILDSEKYGSFGWCFTSQSKTSWGSCSDGCPMYGRYGKLENTVKSLQSDLAAKMGSSSDAATANQKSNKATPVNSDGSTDAATTTKGKSTNVASGATSNNGRTSGLSDWERDLIKDDQPDGNPRDSIHNTRIAEQPAAPAAATNPFKGWDINFGGNGQDLLFTLLFILVSNAIVYKWHSDNTKKGIHQTCGMKSFLCCCCCGGWLTLWQPIDAVVGPPLQVGRSP